MGNLGSQKVTTRMLFPTKKFHIIRPTSLGDVICVEPVARLLDDPIVHTRFPQVFENHPYVRAERNLWPEVGPKDECVSLRNTYENKLDISIVQAYAEVCGVDVVDEIPEIYLSKEEQVWAEEELSSKKWVCMCMGKLNPGPLIYGRRGRFTFQEWRPIVDFVNGKGYSVFCVGLNEDVRPDPDLVRDYVGGINTRMMFSLVDRADYVIGMDGGTMHTANAMSKFGIGIFHPKHSVEKVLGKGTKIKGVERKFGDSLDPDEIIQIIKEDL